MMVPINRKNAKAQPIHIVDGWERGPDGQRLTSFARFAERIMAGGTLDDEPIVRRLTDGARLVHETEPGGSAILLADGRVLVINPDKPPYIVGKDGAVEQLPQTEVG